MKKLILVLLVFTVPIFAQQLNFTFGYDAVSGAALTGVQDNLDSTGTTDYTFLFDLGDYYFVDPVQMWVNDIYSVTGASSDSVGLDTLYGSTNDSVYANTDRAAFGSFWCFFDANNDTDSVRYTIKSYAGIRGTTNESYAGIKWQPTGTTLETVNTRGDYITVKNVYLSSSWYKTFPPEYIKVVIDAVATGNQCNDSTDVYWRYVYPAVYHSEQERRP